jgi:CRISPR-associated protein Cas5t
MRKLAVVRVIVEAPITSFRYPHFLVGRQVTYDMPPPSTIYGHVASALGELPDPVSFQFGYHFRFTSRCSDLEHQHIITVGGQPFAAGGEKHRTATQATVQPHLRDFLFNARLILYVTRPEWTEAFRSPVFCVILGRSQDLASVSTVEAVELEERDGAYFEHTLLPFSYRPYVALGTTALMPTWIEPPPSRRAHFERFVVLHGERLFAGAYEQPEKLAPARRMLQEPERRVWWVDPHTPVNQGVQRGVILHSCA